MKVSGFTFIRNGLKFDYPIVEAVMSILPLCDEFVIAVGKSDDNTLELIQQIEPSKIRIIETIWDDSLRKGGRVLAEETNKAFRSIDSESDWCFYIQGDEVVHEKYHPTIRKAMEKWQHNTNVDGLLFKYKHFYGSYDYVGTSFKWYRNEIRIIKNNKAIYSHLDAQGFRKGDGQKLNVKAIDAYIYHYGWVKDPRAMQLKQETFNKLWHTDKWVNENVVKAESFDYSNIDALELFTDSHPNVMLKRIAEKNWKFDHDISVNRLSVKDKFKRMMLNYFNVYIGYKNYKVI